MALPDIYADDRLVRLYDHLNPWGPDDDFYLSLAGRGPRRVLDLGCGTGRLTVALAAAGHEVIGVDPAEPMLREARARDGGAKVRWLKGDARRLRLGKRFDLVVMTGHVFQVFLTDEDQAAALATVAHHLDATGRFAFETRNPGARAWERWTPEASRRAVDAGADGRVEVTDAAAMDAGTGVVDLITRFRFLEGGLETAAESHLRFTGRDDLDRRLADAGLAAEHWCGDWDGTAWSKTAPEIIVVGHRADPDEAKT